MIFSVKPRIVALGLTLLLASGCMGDEARGEKHLRPLSYAAQAELRSKNMKPEDPILIRIFKEENELEVWKQRRDGRYAHFKTYDICKWSGELGPKIKEGDRQAPEGFYTITPAQMNPNSSYHLSFNLGYPNVFDRAHGRTGRHLMVHGACSSAGCYAMTDDVIQEIYSLARDSFRGGQRDFQVQALPFRMTPQNMARHADNPNMPFWQNLKHGSDHFEVTGLPPKIGVCDRSYVFNSTPADPGQRLDPLAVCPALEVPHEIEVAVAAKQQRDEAAFQVALAQQRNRVASATMLASASDYEEGSSDGYPENAVAMAAPTPVEAAIAPSAPADAPSSATAAFAPSQSPFSGVWNRLVGFARFDALRVPGALTGAAAGDTASELPPLSAASSFAPLYGADPFAVFSLFETVDGVSVPADTVRR